MPIGFTLPFQRSTGSVGYFETTNTPLEATAVNLQSLILTNWGERVMHYNFGCNLQEFLFENWNHGDAREAISDRIISQVAKWLPFVSVSELFVLFPEDDITVPDHGIKIKVKFSLNSRPDLTKAIELMVPFGSS